MAKPRFFRDPVHLQIRFDPVDIRNGPPKGASALSWGALRMIQAPEFQRLRHIRQNGLANLVFYGAEHSRFNHSMGVHYVARSMYERICRNCSEPEDLHWKLASGLAALVHDVGHGPFSHTLEEVLRDNDVDFDHEDMTVRFVKEDNSQIFKVLREIDGQLPALVAAFFDKKSRQADNWAYKIVSSQLDGDRLDYVQRDALFAGLRGHGFDFERLLDLLSHHNQAIAVERGAIEAVEAYLVSLDQAYRAIYYHHAVRAATQMLISLIRRAFLLFKNGDKSVFANGSKGGGSLAALVEKGSSIDLAAYSRLSEFHLWSLFDSWCDSKDFVLRELSKRILCRELFKGIEVDQAEFRKKQDLIKRAQSLVQKKYSGNDGAADHFVLFDEPSRVSYKGYDFNPESHDESIWLVGKGRKPTPLEIDQESPIIQSFRNRRTFSRLFVPPDVRDELTKS